MLRWRTPVKVLAVVRRCRHGAEYTTWTCRMSQWMCRYELQRDCPYLIIWLPSSPVKAASRTKPARSLTRHEGTLSAATWDSSLARPADAAYSTRSESAREP